MSDDLLTVGEETATLADVAGINFDSIDAQRGSTFPGGLFHFKCVDAGLQAVQTGEGKKVPAIIWKLECRDVKEFADDKMKGKESEVIGRVHTEMVRLEDAAKELGYGKAFMEDTGFKGSGEYQQVLKAFVGHEFLAKIKNKPSQNDPDVVFANIGVKIGFWKVVPLQQQAAA